jgi:hypothetical protein
MACSRPPWPSGEVATELSGFLRVGRALGLIEQLETFLPEPVASPTEQLRLHGRRRQRATQKRAVEGTARKWTWGATA